MRERIKHLIAMIMAVLLFSHLPGVDVLIVHAASLYIYIDTDVSADSEDTYVFYSGGCTLTIEADVNIAGVETTGDNSYIVNNGGSVSGVKTSAGNTTLNGGYYGSIYVAGGSGGGVVGNGISAGVVTAEGPIALEGSNTISSITAQNINGSGTVTVTDEVSLQGTDTGVKVNVYKDTIINATYNDLTVYHEGVAYTFAGGTSGNSVLKNYGVCVTFKTTDENINWGAMTEEDNLNSYLWFGDSIGTYKCTAVEGYFFPEDYRIISDGNGVVEATRISDTELHVSYVVSDADSGTVTLTFPALEKRMVNGEGTFTVADITYGEKINPQYTSSTQSISDAVVEYKVLGADDSTYTTTAPAAVGNYTAMVTIPEDDDNYELIMTDDFSINRAVGVGRINVPDTYYGISVSPEVSSDTNLVNGVEVEYKVAGAPDSTYTKTKPTAVGNYVARAILSETDTHTSVVLTDEFTVSYMPVPNEGYYFLGVFGSNNYYISDVTVVAKDGYAISRTLDGEYVRQFTVNATETQTQVFFKDLNTGAKSAGVLMSAIYIDKYFPTIDAEHDKTYYSDILTVLVSDDNLTSISLNGEPVTIEGNNTALFLTSDGGVEEYKIVAIDKAGNVKNMTITVAAEWTKTGVIPSGMAVKLQAGKPYTLGSGTWNVSGDSTSYTGGAAIYVGSEGRYTFNQQ